MDSQVTQFAGANLGVARTPQAAIAEARDVARELVKIVRQMKWEVNIAGRGHLKVEAWQTLSHFYGVTAKITEDEFVQIGDAVGYQATADAILLSTGQVISSAKAMCLNDEENWGARPKYEWRDKPGGGREKAKVGEEQVPLFQLRSMAQTRAQSKVLKNVFAWVVALAGYQSTPAEEMTGSEYAEDRQMPQRASGNGGSDKISEPQRKRLWAIAKEKGWTGEQVKKLLKANGFEKGEDVTRAKYEGLVKAVSEPPAPAAGASGGDGGPEHAGRAAQETFPEYGEET